MKKCKKKKEERQSLIRYSDLPYESKIKKLKVKNLEGVDKKRRNNQNDYAITLKVVDVYCNFGYGAALFRRESGIIMYKMYYK